MIDGCVCVVRMGMIGSAVESGESESAIECVRQGKVDEEKGKGWLTWGQ